jgi:small subunit ribosomal protein S4e
LTKLGGVYATRPGTGPHKMRQCLPLSVLLRNRLKYALNGQEVLKICKDKDNAHIKVDNKVRRDHRFPCGLMDVVSIAKTGEHFRILLDVKGRFQAVPVDAKEASFKLCKVMRKSLGKNKIPYIVTHDGRTIRYPNPDIKVNDCVKLNLETGDLDGVVKSENGASVFISGGNNIGRVGVLQHIEHHPGSYEIAHVKDARGHSFATRLENVFAIGEGKNPVISLPKKKGIKLTLIEERDARLSRHVEEEEEESDAAEEE